MKRAVFCLTLFCALPGLAEASSLTKENCRVTKEIIAVAIGGRKAGYTSIAVKDWLSSGDAGVTGAYLAAVGPLVDWVFALDTSMLTTDTVSEYERQCLKY